MEIQGISAVSRILGLAAPQICLAGTFLLFGRLPSSDLAAKLKEIARKPNPVQVPPRPGLIDGIRHKERLRQEPLYLAGS